MIYHWRHLPTGTEGTRTIDRLPRLDFLTLLAKWNGVSARSGANWLYWE